MDGGDRPAGNDPGTDDGRTVTALPGVADASAPAIIPPMEG